MKCYAFFCYHRKDDNMLETCISSLRAANGTVEVRIATDGVPDELRVRMQNEYAVAWIKVPVAQMRKRRATCKVEVLRDLVKGLKDGDGVLVADVDVYFLADPFLAFAEQPHMDLGLTTRGYDHTFPINGGIFYVRVNERMRAWLKWHLKEIYNPSWAPYISHRQRYKHRRYGLDWSVGQDFLIANWVQQAEVLRMYGVRICDVGPRYNYCPPTEIWGNGAFEKVREAVRDRSVVTIHLKSDLKKMIYEGIFPHAKINYPKGKLQWI